MVRPALVEAVVLTLAARSLGEVAEPVTARLGPTLMTAAAGPRIDPVDNLHDAEPRKTVECATPGLPRPRVR